MNISLDENVDTTDTIKFNLLILVLAPVSHLCHISAASVILSVSYKDVLVIAHILMCKLYRN